MIRSHRWRGGRIYDRRDSHASLRDGALKVAIILRTRIVQCAGNKHATFVREF
jgi:hypothetical protein